MRCTHYHTIGKCEGGMNAITPHWSSCTKMAERTGLSQAARLTPHNQPVHGACVQSKPEGGASPSQVTHAALYYKAFLNYT